MKNFLIINLPIENVVKLDRNDTLNKRTKNNILIRKQKNKPLFINNNDKQTTIDKYYGLYPEETFDYIVLDRNKNGELEKKIQYFYPKEYLIFYDPGRTNKSVGADKNNRIYIDKSQKIMSCTYRGDNYTITEIRKNK